MDCFWPQGYAPNAEATPFPLIEVAVPPVLGMTPTETDVIVALRNFLLISLMTVCPAIEVIRAQVNRVPEPRTPDFVLMTPLRRPRISTNEDDFSECLFTASITGTTMTVTAVSTGKIIVGNTLAGANVSNAIIQAQLSGTPGNVGTYKLSASLIISSQQFATGTMTVIQHTQYSVQLDVHGPQSGDNAQIISTLFRDQFAVGLLQASGFDIEPLYAEEPRQMPFINDQGQYEYRWIVEVQLQVNPAVTTGAQQFSASGEVTFAPVEALFPPRSN